MADLLAGLKNLLWPGRGRKRRANRRNLTEELFPALNVRMLEERRVFHADAIAAPIAGATTQEPPPPPPATTISLDADQNLLIRDASPAGQDNQLTIRFDSAAGYYEVTDSTQVLTTNIVGATGSGSHNVFIPVAAIAGDALIVAAGAGNDSLTADLTSGLAGKSLLFDGGQGQDSLTLVGGKYGTVGYAIAADGDAQIQMGSGSSPATLQVHLISAESVLDQLVVDSRQFTLGGGIAAATLTAGGVADNGFLQLTTTSGSQFRFTTPLAGLSLTAANQTGLEIAGQTNLNGANLTIRAGSIDVTGQVSTHHATIELSAQSSLNVTTSGRIDNHAGKTVLDAGDSGTLQVSGRIDVSTLGSSERGGIVHLLGQKVELLQTASIEASGPAGGGTVLVGGDYQGLNPAVRNATATFVHADASIRANALASGDGGKIIIWANDSAIVAGSGNLQARGGPQGGNGGLIETSGKRYLSVGLAPDASAPAGSAGLWLLDPINVSIVSAGTGSLTGGVFTSDATHSSIDPAVIAAALSSMNVVINTGAGAGDGDIIVVDAITPNLASPHALTLNAARDIVLQADIAPTAGNLEVILNAGRNVNFVGGSISANIVSIAAAGSITSGSDPNDVSVSGAGAEITIDAASIGTAAQPLELSPGSGSVNLTAQTGGIFVRFDAGISTSQLTLSAPASGQTIRLATENGSIVFDNVSGFDTDTADDAFDVQAAGANQDITFASGITLIADSVNLQATDQITASSAAAIADTSATDGTISLSAASLGSATNPLRVNPGLGELELTATSGDIYVRTAAGKLATSQITVLSAAKVGAIISLGADADSVVIDQVSQFDSNTSNDDLEFVSGTSDITVDTPITTSISGSHSLTLDAFRDIILDDDIDPAAGTLSVILSAGRNVNFVAGSISANTVSVNADGLVNSGSDPNDISVAGAGAAISVDAASIGSAAQPLELSPGSAGVSLTTQSGGIFVRFAAGISTSQLTLSAVAAGQTVGLATENGSVLFDSVAGFDLNTRDDEFDVQAAGAGRDIVFSSGVTLVAAAVNLQAADDITAASGAAIADTSAAAGTISLIGASLGDAANPLRLNPGAGDLELTATAGDIYVRTTSGDLATSQITLLSAGQAGATISLGADAGGIVVDQISQFNPNTNNDHFELMAGTGEISLSANSALVAASATLTATNGDILATVAGIQLDTSAASGLIRLDASSVGSSGQAIVIDPAAGDVEVVADTGDVYLTFAASFATGQFNELNVTASGRQIVLTAASGSITVNNTTGFANTADDHFTLLAPAGGVAFTGGTLTAASATIDASTTITRSGAAALDINTLALNGPISLTADAGIGASTNRLRVSAGLGIVEATTTTGSVWLSSPLIQLGTIQTGLGQQTVSVVTTAGGDLNVRASSTTDDNWQLSSAGDLSLIGAVTLQAARFTQLQAAGDLRGGSAAVDLRQVGLLGTIVIDAASVGTVADPIVVDLDATSTLDLQANTGDLCLTLASGDLTAARLVGGTITAAGSGVTISLTTQDGSLDLGTPSFLGAGHADDFLRLEARGAVGNISLGTSTLTFSEVTLLADGAITSLSLGTAIDTSAADGDITLQSGGPIGISALAPLRIELGNGQVSAVTSGSLGDIFLESTGNLLLGNIDAQDALPQIISIATTGGSMQVAADWTTEDLIFLTSNGNITFLISANITAAAATLTSTTGTIRGSGGAEPDISTSAASGPINLNAQAIGEAATVLLIDPGTGLVGVTSATDAFLSIFSGNFTWSQFSALNLNGSNETFDLNVLNGSLTINSVFNSLNNDNLFLSAAGPIGNIAISAAAPLTGRSVELQATGAITGGSNTADITASVGNIVLSGDDGIGQSSAIPLTVSTTNPVALVTATTVTGDIFLRSPGAMRLGAVNTAAGVQRVEVTAASDLELAAASTTDDAWALTSSTGDLHFAVSSNLVAGSFTANASGAIFSDNTGIDVDTGAADGAISLTGASLGDLARSLVLSLGSGDLSLHAIAGDIRVALDGGSFNSSQVQDLRADAAGADVNLTTLNGSLTLSSFANFHVTDDFVSLTTQGAASNINFTGSGGPLIAAQATLTAGGSIHSSGAAALDINTSAAGNPLRLTAGVEIGQSNAPLIVLAGAGQVSAESGSGDIYIQSPGTLLVNRAVATAAGRQISFATTGTGNSLVVEVDSLSSDGDQWHLSATGDLTLRVADAAGIHFGQLLDIAATSPNRDVLIEATAGSIVLDTIHTGILTADDRLTLLTQTGSITSPASTPISAQFLSLQAPAAGGQIGAPGNPVEFLSPHLTTVSGGSQWLVTPTLTRIVSAETTAPGGGINLLSGTFLLIDPGPGSATVETNGGELLVGSTAVLGGRGSIAGDLHVLSDGVVSPGFGGPGAGRIVIMGDVIFDARSMLIVNINDPYLDPGVDYDHLRVTGNVQLDNPILMLSGAEQLSTTVNPIVLIELVDPTATTTGTFDRNAGSLFFENGVIRAVTGQFRGNLLFNGGDGNDIILSQLSFVPQRPPPISLVPRLRIPTFTTLQVPPPVVQTPPVLQVAATPPVVEAESTPIGVRFLEVRIVIVIDEAGNVREEFAMKLSTDWLTNLPAVFRRLPDDRYRIYLILEGGNEERLVIDVLVRDGRPVEPGDTTDDAARDAPAPPAQPSDQPGFGQAEVLPSPPAGPPVEPVREPVLLPENGAFNSPSSSPSSRLHFGAAAALAAVVASRQTSNRWTEEVDQAAESIGRTRPSLGWRWWRFAGHRSATSES